MNERIKEMWEESTGSMFPRPGSFTAGEYDYHLEKFAELIVRECVEYYRSQVGETSEPHTRTLEHFGVEE
jgi:hypothetical protein